MVFEKPLPFDTLLLDCIQNDSLGIQKAEEHILNLAKEISSKEDQIQTCLLGIRCMDLTTLNADDTGESVRKLCCRSVNPLRRNIVNDLKKDNLMKFDEKDLHVAAVCFYPNFLEHSFKPTKQSGKPDVKIAATTTGFPTGQLLKIHKQIEEIKEVIANGSEEIDVVINRSLALNEEWKKLYDEIALMRIASKGISLKVILEVGELARYDLIFKASMVAMMAGADVIKTSTGKTKVNATIPYGIIMSRAINLFRIHTGRKVGLKAAGGIRNLNDVKCWVSLIRYYLGEEYLNPTYFRIGASSLLGELEKDLFRFVYNRLPSKEELSL